MKLLIVAGLLITAALSFVTNLVSNFLSQKAKKNQKFLWILFGILIIASIIVGIIPQEWYSSKVEILDVAVSKVYKDKEVDNLSYVYCEQQIKLINRGNTNTSVVKYSTTLKYRDFVAVAESFSSHATQFFPYDIDARLGHLEVGAIPFVGDNLAPLPSIVFSQNTLDFIASIHFAFAPSSYEIFDIHSDNVPENSAPFLIQYKFDIADGSKIESDEIPCVFINAKTILAPSP